MKKFKKLIPALCMLLISAVLMGTSTYAWFSMNTKVTATGMEVNAKSESQFLQIVAGTDAFSNDAAQISANAKNDKKSVRPVTAVKKVVATPGATSITTLTSENAKDLQSSEIKWAEAFSNDPSSSAKVGDYKDVSENAIASTDDNIYTLINSFKVRLNPATGSNIAANLKVQSLTITAKADGKTQLLPAVRVLITCGEKWVMWKNGQQVVGCDGDSKVIAASVTTTETSINVYIFFDGEDAATTTNNATTVGSDGYKVEFVLGID